MKPKYLSLTNFKSIGSKPQRIELAPITLLFGPNSAGKSTLIQALIYLNEILLHRNYDPDRTSTGGDWLDLGGFRNMVHNHDVTEAIKIVIGFDASGVELPDWPDYLSDSEKERFDLANIGLPEDWFVDVEEFSIGLTIRWSKKQGRPFVESYEAGINSEHLALIRSTEDGKQVFLEQLNLSHPIFRPGISVENNQVDTDLEQGTDAASLIRLMLPDATAVAMNTLFVGDRPFASNDLDELEEMLDFETKGKQAWLKKLVDELDTRPSRRASMMSKRVNAAIQQSWDERAELGAVVLAGQKDALPFSKDGLSFAGPVLDESSDSEFMDLDISLLLGQSLLSGFIVGPQLVVTQWLEEFRYIGPLRDLPPRNLQPHLSPDNARWAKGLAAWEMLHQASRDQIDEINFWLGEHSLKTGYQVVVHRYRELPQEAPIMAFLDQEMDLDQQLVLKDQLAEIPVKTRVTLVEDTTGLEVMPQDIGVGISQLFPVIVLTITQNEGLIVIEQPELHLHPAIQVELADLFARYILKHDKFMLLETHSEHLMLRLLRRIREQEEKGIPDGAIDFNEALPNFVDVDAEFVEFNTKLDHLNKNSLSVQYVESTEDGTIFTRLRVDDDGDFLDEWPKGFFDERDDELF